MLRTVVVVVTAVTCMAACGDGARIGEPAVRCGDGVVQAGEGCDLGTANSDAPDAACRSDCQPRRCGDGIVDPAAGEACEGATSDACGCRAGCVFEPTTTVCRASVGACDADDTCDGAGACRGDGKRVGTVCRAPTAPCDAAERCDGEGDACPADALLAAGVPCRPSAGQCDVAELCDGASATCGDDTFADDGTACDEGCADQCLCAAGACRPHCGNGTTEAALGEACDDGAANGALGACRTSCVGDCFMAGAAAWPFPAGIYLRDSAVTAGGRRYVVGANQPATPQPPIGDAPQIVRDAQGDGLVVALDPDGSVAWSQCFAGLGQDMLWRAAADDDGVTVVGHVSAGMRIGCCGDVDPSACPVEVPTTETTSWILFARLGHDGGLRWKYLMPGAAYPQRVAIAPGGDSLIAGALAETQRLVLGPVAGEVREAEGSGAYDGFIVRVARDGTPRWVRMIGSPGDEKIDDLTVRPDGRIIVHLRYFEDFRWGGYDFVGSALGTDVLVELDADATRVLAVRRIEATATAEALRRVVAQGDGVWVLASALNDEQLDVGAASPVPIAAATSYLLRFTSLAGSDAPAVFGPLGLFDDSAALAAFADGVVFSANGVGTAGVPGLAAIEQVAGHHGLLVATHGAGGIVARSITLADANVIGRVWGLGVDVAGRASVAFQSGAGLAWGDVAIGAPGGVVTYALPDGCDACGDGAVHGLEVCDDGDTSDCTGACDALCLGAGNTCGDGVARCGEELDPGGGVHPAATCGGCGNGVVTPGEVCDADPLGARDGCKDTCDGACDVAARWTSVLGDGSAADVDVSDLRALPDGGALVGATVRVGAAIPLASGETLQVQAHDPFDIDNLLYQLDPDGRVRWATCFGSATDFAEARLQVRVDGDGVWAMGNWRSDVEDFCCPGVDPAAEPRTCDDDIQRSPIATGNGAYIARFDRDGRFRFARGGTSTILDAEVDPAGDLIVLAQDQGQPGVAWAGLTAEPGADGADLTMLALAPSGAPRWLRTYRQPGTQNAIALAVADDGAGAPPPAGEPAMWALGVMTGGAFTLGPDTLPAPSMSALWLAAFDASGAPLWLKAPPELAPTPYAYAADLVYGCRAPGDCALFAALQIDTTSGEAYGLIVRLGLDGTVEATTRLTVADDYGPYPIELHRLGVDGGRGGRVTLVGAFAAPLELTGGPTLVPIAAADAYDDQDLFLARADWDLAWLWARQAGSTAGDFARAAAIAADGGAFVSWFSRVLVDLTVDDVTVRDVEDRAVVTRFVPREDGCAVCGDGAVGPGESCDDGETDACAGTCDAQCAGAAGGATCGP